MAGGKNHGRGKPPAQKKPPLTHFLCLPLVTRDSKPQLQASVEKFKDIVTTKNEQTASKDGDSGDDESSKSETITSSVHPKAIRPVGALHCTLGVMSLDQNKLEEAKELLRHIDIPLMLQHASSQKHEQANVTDVGAGEPLVKSSESPPHTAPLRIDLRGLVSMHAPQKTSILYSAPVDQTGRLYPFCLAVQERFKGLDLLVKDDRKLKLHATIVNTIYAKGRKQRLPPKWKMKQQTTTSGQIALASSPEGLAGGKAAASGDKAGDETSPKKPEQGEVEGHGPNANAPLKIDATSILEEFKDFVWAENFVLDRIAICEMGAKKITNDEGGVVAEEYTEVASVKLPT
ncbi:hypothetical protein KC332_g11391 [Hortaea werneckii]|uniref:A-kinase anchor protein 7-like phosphoesterase domain-containing protein n=2 Tax=Hortaea werneckii TaxID=91943 RepID=A0A3M7IP64_HORWE|nr:hypothetical protein KC358_g10139 [Hortaea werneckii]OTA36932.1 hypothetical protein BTJ68_03757 [Hortaea werneckii EXF-2000]KAI6822076.1 hypothetical protein KC350_g9430 [Hortaea werneckii]KAI6835625.1 hypothetical protein KC342_g5584 [Hortaea werneckii]KAI6938272.1 hypothetical protein KC341_g5002 [Hortaea werneckii]